MESGNIVEFGSHNDLIVQDGMYKRLVDAQMLSKEEPKMKSGVSTSELKDEKVEVVDLKRKSDDSSIHNDIETGGDRKLSAFQVTVQILALNAPELKYIIPGFIAAIGAGLVYPAFAVVFANIITVFSKTGKELHDGASFWVKSITLLFTLGCYVYCYCFCHIVDQLFNEHTFRISF